MDKFWEKPLESLNDQEWESLCDGCGRCCLHKIEDEDSKEVFFTNVACKYMDEESCSCPHYDLRQQLVPNCLSIDAKWGEKFNWLPSTCAYRMLYEGKELEPWHPLISGDKNSVHYAGISIRGRNYRDDEVDEKDFVNYVVDWIK